jgi:protein-disulfide isomerase
VLVDKKNYLAIGLILALLIVVVLFSWQILAGYKKIQPSIKNDQSVIDSDLKILHIFPQDPSLGTANPELTIVMFSDFACPYCADSFPILEQFANSYPSRIRLVWKDAIASNHQQAALAAQAAHCANTQGKFWEYARMLFSNQSQLSPIFLSSLAKNLNLNQTSFQTCLANNITKPLVDFNQQQVEALGIRETPTIFVNGVLYNGDISLAALEQFLVK